MVIDHALKPSAKARKKVAGALDEKHSPDNKDAVVSI